MGHRKTRPHDELMTIILKLSEGNPGAATCLIELFQKTQKRPLLFGYGVEMFETLRLYGTSLYMLWNDCLDRDTHSLARLIECWCEGAVSSDTILYHVNTVEGRGLPLDVPKGVIF